MKASDFTEQRVRKLIKTSQNDEEILGSGTGLEDLEGMGQQVLDYLKENPDILGSIIGAAGGTALGGFSGNSSRIPGDDNRLMKMILGGLGGGGVGYAGGSMVEDWQESQNEGLSDPAKYGLAAAGGAGAAGAGTKAAYNRMHPELKARKLQEKANKWGDKWANKTLKRMSKRLG